MLDLFFDSQPDAVQESMRNVESHSVSVALKQPNTPSVSLPEVAFKICHTHFSVIYEGTSVCIRSIADIVRLSRMDVNNWH